MLCEEIENESEGTNSIYQEDKSDINKKERIK